MDETNIKKRLSIIVPVYNVEKYIERCLLSLLNQDIPKSEYEIIVVNDGTPDNSADIAQSIADKNENIIVVHRENGGLSAARNTGMEHAHGEYVMFVDSDDYLMPNVLASMVDTATTQGLDILEARMKLMKADGSFSESLIQPFSPDIVYTGEYALLHDVNIASVCGMLYSSHFLETNNLWFTEGMTHEDADFNTRCYPLATKIIFSDIISYVYFWNDSSLNRSVDINKVRKAIIDDITIAANTIRYTELFRYNERITTLYYKRSNSIICAVLLRLLKDKTIPLEIKDECIIKMKSNNLYPIKGETLSWKTTILKYLLNQEWLYKRFL
jgi:glycosyltransferase involved in cell wall biosynthesis